MKRIALIGVLMLILTTLAGPAFAQVDEDGSVLPGPAQEQPLPIGDVDDDAPAPALSVPRAAELADTGFALTNGVLLAAGLVVVGGLVLVASRRREAR